MRTHELHLILAIQDAHDARRSRTQDPQPGMCLLTSPAVVKLFALPDPTPAPWRLPPPPPLKLDHSTLSHPAVSLRAQVAMATQSSTQQASEPTDLPPPPSLACREALLTSTSPGPQVVRMKLLRPQVIFVLQPGLDRQV